LEIAGEPLGPPHREVDEGIERIERKGLLGSGPGQSDLSPGVALEAEKRVLEVREGQPRVSPRERKNASKEWPC
jgi:hypothetical protein